MLDGFGMPAGGGALNILKRCFHLLSPSGAEVDSFATGALPAACPPAASGGLAAD
jgi:hypothetical protein